MSVIHLDLNKFQIIPIADSARRLKISDDEYFFRYLLTICISSWRDVY